MNVDCLDFVTTMASFNLLRFARQRITRLSVRLPPLPLLHDDLSIRQYSSNTSDKVLTLTSVNQNLRYLRYEVRGIVPKRAGEIEEELKVCVFT